MEHRLRLINLILLVAVGLLGYSLYQNWSSFRQQEGQEKETVVKKAVKARRNPSVKLEGLFQEVPPHSFAFYQEVVKKNLFSPERKEPEQALAGEEPDTGTSRTLASYRFVLYGVAMVGDQKRALLGFMDTDPVTKGRREKVRTVKEGEQLRNFKVVSISPAAITLKVDQETLTLGVYDPKNPRTRRVVRTAPTGRRGRKAKVAPQRRAVLPPAKAPRAGLPAASRPKTARSN